MKKLIWLFVAISVLTGSTVFADGEFIGPALRVDSADVCGVFIPEEYFYGGIAYIQFSNGKRGHATYKCKLALESGDPQVLTLEFDTGEFPLSDAGYYGGSCYTTIEIEGETGMWTSQCFNAWESGD
jgi:hypothetical protein